MNPDASIARLLSTPWMVDRLYFDNILFRLAPAVDQAAIHSIETPAHSAAPRFAPMNTPSGTPNSYQIISGVAVIPVAGTILKDVPFYYELFDIAATSTEVLREQIEGAIANPAVDSILLEIDSPGGTSSGVSELGDAILRARTEKTIHAIIRDLGASAAYWLASQASHISASPTTSIGSIGTYIAVYDSSEFYESQGIHAIVVASGEHKGAGIEGTKITEEQIAPWQEMVDGLTTEFVAAIARGRGVDMAVIAPLATGRTWLATPARELGLIDVVENFDDALTRLIHL